MDDGLRHPCLGHARGIRGGRRRGSGSADGSLSDPGRCVRYHSREDDPRRLTRSRPHSFAGLWTAAGPRARHNREMTMTELDRYADEALGQFTDDLVEFCRFPSESTEPAALSEAADWTAERLRRAGATVEVLTLSDDSA